MIDPSVVGRSFAPVTAHVEAGRLRFFLDTLGEANAVYRDGAAARLAGFEAVPVPPTYLFCLDLMDAATPLEFLGALGIDIGRILHGDQRFSYHAPVVLGDTLTFQQRVAGVTDKKGGSLTFLALETRVTNQAGTHVADMASTIVVRN